MRYWRVNNSYYLILFISFLIIFSLLITGIPMGDDFTQIGLSSENNFFTNISRGLETRETLNGRVLGNTSLYVFIKIWWVNALARTLVIILAAHAMQLILGTRKNIIFLLLLSIMVMIPFSVHPEFASIFTQAILWSAGFYNYVPPLMLLLYLLVLIRNSISFINLGTIFIFSFATTLFVENITAATLMFSLGFVFYSFIKLKTKIWQSLAFFFGVISGALFMFSSEIYINVLTGDDEYRDIEYFREGALERAFVDTIPNFNVVFLKPLTTLFLIIAIAIFYLNDKNRSSKNSLFINLYMLSSILSFLILNVFDGKNTSFSNLLLSVFSFLLFFFSALISIILISKYIKNEDRALILLLVSYSLVSILPFLVLSPFGARNAYTPFVLISFSIVLLLRDAIIFCFTKKTNIKILSNILIASSLMLLTVQTGNRHVFNQNLNTSITAIELNQETILLKLYPFKAFLHDSTNVNKYKRLLAGKYLDFDECSATKCEMLENMVIEFK